MEVSQKTVMMKAKKDQFIYFPEDPSRTIFFLKEGRIKIGSTSDAGKQTLKIILQPGEIFGELSIVGEESRMDFAQALDDNILICAMSKEDMEDLMGKNPQLSLRLTKLMGFRLKRIERKLNDLIFKDARERIIDFIREMGEEQGKKVGDETLIKHNLTHQEIANLTASSRQTVTTLMNELRDKNIINFERKRILVRDMSKLV